MTAHPDPELLALAALPAEPTDLGVAAHLQSCEQCRAHVDALRRTVDLARDDTVGDLPAAPPPRVWAAISEELGLDARSGPDTVPDPAPLPARQAGRRSRRTLLGAAAAAAVVGLAAGIGIGLGLAPDPAPPPEPAPLVRLGPVGFADAAATGTVAMVERNGDQKMVMALRGVTDLAGGDYLEAWLMDATGTRLLSLGALARHGEEFRGEFTVPAGLPAGEFDRVDVSAERFDGNPGHSSVSLLRGDLA
jgi:hypothetical protein